MTALRTRVSRAARAEGGFTLIELMVAASVGTLVLLVAFALLDATSKSYSQLDARIDTTQRARLAMDRFERMIRSQACPDPTTAALMEATDNSVTLYVDFQRGNTFTPEQHRLELTAGKLVDSSLAGTYPTQTITSTNTLAANTGQVGTTPIFQYYAWKAGVSGAPNTPTQLLTTPLSAADLKRVVKISINFAALPTKYVSKASLKTVLSDDVQVRTADPSDLTGPKCTG
jgi:prepilin-type N-terminal cleavage/methylation domain-containing protein